MQVRCATAWFPYQQLQNVARKTQNWLIISSIAAAAVVANIVVIVVFVVNAVAVIVIADVLMSSLPLLVLPAIACSRKHTTNRNSPHDPDSL